ncbi:hypothetical protein MZM54_03585 [[Brevibacterium] frigoritolerans]|nr:hypothetical protein [Peribacillus frigoritolerans]
MEPMKIGNIELEEICDYCEGKGRDRYDEYKSCHICGEKGMVLTKEGENILKLVKKYSF